MAKETIPVYDICTISPKDHQSDLLIERFGSYLEKHYQNLHHPHRHSFYHLVLFTTGNGSHTIDFERFRIKPFQIYFMIPGQVHSWHFEDSVDGYIVHFNEVLFTSFLQNSHYLDRFSFFSGNAAEGVCQLPETIHDEVVRIFESMLEEIKDSSEQSLDMIRLKLLNLFISTDRACSDRSYTKIPQHKSMLLRSFRQLINKHYRTLKLPREYADLLYITPNHLNALCQDLVGKKAGDMIRDRILLEAKRLLTNADMTISQVAYELNFQDNSYFNRFFRKYEGITPDEFRKKFNDPIRKSNR